MSHAIDIWRLVAAEPDQRPGSQAATEPLPPDAMDDAVVELSRRYPGLSRALAEYLAR
jgi:hypothetical protein